MNTPLRRRQSDISPVPFPVLIADIGGTNVRLAILSDSHSTLRTFPTVQTGSFPGFAAAATETVLDTTAIMPRSLLIAIAGPITNGPMKLTNADWVIDLQAIMADLNLETVVAFNDFEALSLALPALTADQLMQIGGGEAQPRAPRVVIGPGTGLGVAALIYGDQSYTPLAGEGGHVNFGPETARDFAIWPHLDPFHGRISGEALLSGNGLARIYRAICAAGGETSDCARGEDVTGRADAGDPAAEEAVDLFLTYLGRLAGDLALMFLAKGGVYIAGGIAPRLADRFEKSGFRAAFEAKAPHAGLIAQMPTYLVTEPRPAVTGLSTFAIMPERFALDLGARRHDR
ncbi:glucokinase [Acuticoccus sp. MNP-M23]|uniref:glucokinase n=1 Tax=Acuticoccus sp. MNP-M23 TaxID=3072793 RepID=UPI00281527D6|nr:glucokinase [Acuticoccus sp. MNP-M23]WMS43051.1 glucokinase [Acuticoccus sp. MNP-M23]